VKSPLKFVSVVVVRGVEVPVMERVLEAIEEVVGFLEDDLPVEDAVDEEDDSAFIGAKPTLQLALIFRILLS